MSAKILLVEDNKSLNILFCNILKRNEYEVIPALNGVEALSLLDSNDQISIILSDIMMPQMDGIEFVKKAKTRINRSGIKTCMLSALSDMDKIEECLAMGVDDYIIKITDEELLINKIQFLLGLNPTYEYSNIYCREKEKLVIDSKNVDCTIVEIHEDYFVFLVRNALRIGSRIHVTEGKIRRIISGTKDIWARVFKLDRDGQDIRVMANYIGLTENQIKSLRYQTLRGGEGNEE